MGAMTHIRKRPIKIIDYELHGWNQLSYASLTELNISLGNISLSYANGEIWL